MPSRSVNRETYEPTWSSLSKHQVPQWFRNAKFGIYFHWGPYSVPAYSNEWYSRNMYVEGHDAQAHHVSTYGPLATFGYKDFVPMFQAENFDPDLWAELFRKAGARFAGPVAEHADGFSMWDSQLTPYDAAKMGPKRDIVSDMARAIRGQGLKFITTFHHMWLWGWYPTYDDQVDASNPAFSQLYGPKTFPGAFNDPKPDKRFCDAFVAKVNEVVDKYSPDLLYFDSRFNTISESHRRELLTHYYNKALERGQEVAVTYKNQDLPFGVGILDIERGRMSDLKEFPWLTDDSICWRSWAHLKNPDYKSVKRIIDSLVDIVSKNGNLLLNITPTADGQIPMPVQDRLLGIGSWLEIHGEAIYDTRPWHTYGEGPSQVHEGHFSETKNPEFTAKDIRFTTKGNILYAIIMGIPEQPVMVRSISPRTLGMKRISNVSMLGVDSVRRWSLDENGLKIDTPGESPSEYACAFKITLSEA